MPGMALTSERMFYEVMWRASARQLTYPVSWWVQQTLRRWIDDFDQGLFDSKEAAFASNALYRYWNMIGVKDHVQESLVGQVGEIEPVYEAYAVFGFVFEPAGRRLHLPHLAEPDRPLPAVTQRIDSDYLPVVLSTYRTDTGIVLDQKAVSTTVGIRQRDVVLDRLSVIADGGPRRGWLCLAVLPSGPSSFQRHDRAGRYLPDRQISFLRYNQAENRVEVNTGWGPIFDTVPASFGGYGNPGSSSDPDSYLTNNPFQDLVTTGALNGADTATDMVASLCTGVFAWPFDLAPAATFQVDVRLPVDDYRGGQDLAEIRAPSANTLEAANRAFWTGKLDGEGLQLRLPPLVAHLFNLFRLCRANLLILADSGAIHPGPTIYDSFWVRNSSVEGIACALAGDTGLAATQFGAVGGGEGDQVHAVGFMPDVAPGAVGGVLDDPDQQQGEPAQLDVGADPVLPVVEHRPERERALHVLPPALDGDELLVRGGQILWRERLVVGAQQPLAVQAGLPADRGLVDPQQPGLGAAQPRLAAQGPHQLVPLALRPGIRALDQVLQVGGQPLADQPVPLGLLGVVADGEPLGSFAGILAGHPDLLDPQVPGDLVVAALPGQRRGSLAVRVAELPGVDVVPAAPAQVGAVRGGGEPAVGDPHQAARVPRAQVILDRADDLLVLLVAGEGPAAHRDAVPGDCHRDHHLGQVIPVILGVPEPPGALLLGQLVLVLVLAVLARAVFAGDVGEPGGHLHLPVGGGGVDEDDVDVEVQQVRHRPEDPGGDLLQRREQEVHRPVGLVIAEAWAALDEHPLGHPSRGRELRRRLQRPLRGQREDHPLGRRPVQPPAFGRPADRGPDLQQLPGPAQHPRPAHPPRVQDLDLAGRGRGCCLAGLQEPGDRPDQPGQRGPVHEVRAAEVVDHLRDRTAGHRVPLVVRQLQGRHHGAVHVPPPRLPQVHAYRLMPASLLDSATRR